MDSGGEHHRQRNGGDEVVDDVLFMTIMAIIQWMNRRNAVVMVVLQAAASMPVFNADSQQCFVLLAGCACHTMAVEWLAMRNMERVMDDETRIWVLQRSGRVWKDLQSVGHRHDKVFVRFCRLPRPLFHDALQRIGPHIQRQTTNWRQPLPAEQKFACALIRWAAGGYYRQSGHGLGIGLMSALRSSKDVVKAIVREYAHVISFPQGRRLEDCLDHFECKGFPRCVGAIDCTHFYIEKHRNERLECYYDRTRQFSIIAQVVCDHECRISYVYVGSPGSVHNSRVLRMSRLCVQGDSGEGVFSGEPTLLRDGTSIAPYLLKDAGFPLLDRLMTPHSTRRDRTPAQVTFDDVHSMARNVIERTFDILKGIWRNFLRRQIDNLKTICCEFMVVCILHNLLTDYKVDLENMMESDDDLEDDDSNDHNRRRRRRPVVPSNARDEEDDADVRVNFRGLTPSQWIRVRLVRHVGHHVRVHGPPDPGLWQA
ncbi:hypothetical protein CBR_g39995 [Chara braunii]|uniref:DDE Tnp4 domain-containing protein n=1 Tax=Chara braunii TaxID=69332 RepID=A0A388LT17_CHABU|nr:hypothetical protein CBR_g39995 [Chara braunii]|eukprot:GBG85352.1 hypothetical protein CBR_g39995 [Chara braunii]